MIKWWTLVDAYGNIHYLFEAAIRQKICNPMQCAFCIRRVYTEYGINRVKWARYNKIDGSFRSHSIESTLGLTSYNSPAMSMPTNTPRDSTGTAGWLFGQGPLDAVFSRGESLSSNTAKGCQAMADGLPAGVADYWKGVDQVPSAAAAQASGATRVRRRLGGGGGYVFQGEEMERYAWLMELGDGPLVGFRDGGTESRGEESQQAVHTGDRGSNAGQNTSNIAATTQLRHSVSDLEQSSSTSEHLKETPDGTDPHQAMLVCTLHEFEGLDLENRLSTRVLHPNLISGVSRESRCDCSFSPGSRLHMLFDQAEVSASGSEPTRSSSCHSRSGLSSTSSKE